MEPRADLSAGPEGSTESAQESALRGLWKRRRRFSRFCFLIAGAGFGTAFYVLRIHFGTLGSPHRAPALLVLIGVASSAFLLGARTEAELIRLDDELRDLRAKRALDRKRDAR